MTYDIHKLWFVGIAFLLLTICSCAKGSVRESPEFEAAKELSLEWNRLVVDLERYTPGYRPPVTSRMFAYVSCAAWQAALPKLPGCISIENYCPDYKQPTLRPGSFYLPASLNAAYAEIIRQFFPTAPAHLLEKIQWLESEQAEMLRKKTDPDTYRKSANYGKRVAVSVWLWSVADSIGHDAFLYNFDRSYVPPQCAGCWQPSGDHPMPPLLPNWGKVRTFIVDTGSVEIKPPAPYDERPNSAYYSEAMEVYSISKPLSKENQWIAELWSDDVPGLTVSPAGRWISIINQTVELAQPPLAEMLELYLKIGIALSDAMVISWQVKYHFNRERPEAYIRKKIQVDWKPLHNNPPFPSYPSGHAALSMAATVILNQYFGKHFEFTDRTHEDRKEFEGKARTYRSFEEMARENAVSRIALGVHFRTDCEEGIRIGQQIGRRVSALILHNTDTTLNR